MSIKTYSYNDTTQLTPHFNVKEFKCQCGKSHDILISEELVSKLEELYEALDCSKIIITSGYRCAEHDKAVGGTSTGQHTKGTAADICCYAQDGSKISSKTVCCKAQDLGFTGIANITSEYVYAHVDVRSGSKWYGNEVVNNSTVTNDFYEYYGISKDTESKTAIKGIDVSYCQGNVNWSHVKTSGVQFAIIRAGYGKELTQKDKQFENNYAGCKSNGVPVGAYWFSYALTPDEAKKEAEVCLQIIKGKTFEYPIYFDLEEQNQFKTGKENCSAMVEAFCNTLEEAGYYAGLYCSTYYLNNYVTEAVRNRYAIWVAQYSDSCTYSGDYGIWQCGVSKEKEIYGVDTTCDLDYCYIDYPMFIKNAGLNGFAKTDNSTDSVETVENTSDADTLKQILEHVASIDEKLK